MPRRDLQRLINGHDWYGFLALDNFDEVVSRIKMMIGNGQPYTWVATNEAFGLRAEVRASMVAEKISVETSPHDDGTPRGHVWVCDTYGVWGVSTTAPDQASARDGGKSTCVFLNFERTCYGEKLTIEHYVLAGDRVCWVIALEAARDGAS
ncbi:hypothetical protein [Nonomuraea sp. NPDC050643]|uniref:hypothetical protein n=1 Tax=Nonomuraea sp. NPDC050643 TaxID=3155660 RepID=UPI0033C096BB